MGVGNWNSATIEISGNEYLMVYKPPIGGWGTVFTVHDLLGPIFDIGTGAAIGSPITSEASKVGSDLHVTGQLDTYVQLGASVTVDVQAGYVTDNLGNSTGAKTDGAVTNNSEIESLTLAEQSIDSSGTTVTLRFTSTNPTVISDIVENILYRPTLNSRELFFQSAELDSNNDLVVTAILGGKIYSTHPSDLPLLSSASWLTDGYRSTPAIDDTVSNISTSIYEGSSAPSFGKVESVNTIKITIPAPVPPAPTFVGLWVHYDHDDTIFESLLASGLITHAFLIARNRDENDRLADLATKVTLCQAYSVSTVLVRWVWNGTTNYDFSDPQTYINELELIKAEASGFDYIALDVEPYYDGPARTKIVNNDFTAQELSDMQDAIIEAVNYSGQADIVLPDGYAATSSHPYNKFRLLGKWRATEVTYFDSQERWDQVTWPYSIAGLWMAETKNLGYSYPVFIPKDFDKSAWALAKGALGLWIYISDSVWEQVAGNLATYFDDRIGIGWTSPVEDISLRPVLTSSQQGELTITDVSLFVNTAKSVVATITVAENIASDDTVSAELFEYWLTDSYSQWSEPYSNLACQNHSKYPPSSENPAYEQGEDARRQNHDAFIYQKLIRAHNR